MISIYLIFANRTRAIRKQRHELELRVKERTSELEMANRDLKDALNNVQLLQGLLPICASCKKIRDDKGYWHQVETYIRDHTEVQFSHGMCPDCFSKIMNESGLGDKLQDNSK